MYPEKANISRRCKLFNCILHVLLSATIVFFLAMPRNVNKQKEVAMSEKTL
jgi:hypothetical protein